MVKSFENDDVSMRLRNESLAVGAIVTYQFNAIIYRPAEGRAEKVLLEAACQHNVDQNGCSYPSLYDRGCYFLSDIVKTDNSYHLPTVRPIDSAVLESLYRRDSIHDIATEFLDSQTCKRKGAHVSISYTLKRRKTTATIMESTNDDSDGGEWSGDSLDAEDMNADGDIEEPFDGDDSDMADGTGVEIEQAEDRNTLWQSGEDLTAPQSQPLTRIVGGAMSDKGTDVVLHIMRQFPADIFELISKPRKGDRTPWILPDMTQTQLSNINLFKSFNLSSIFRMAQYKIVGPVEWEKVVFDRYFPPKGAAPRAGLQHFPVAQYFLSWTALLEGVDIPCAEKLRGLFLTWFQQLWWVPFPASDRMWNMKEVSSTKQFEWFIVPPGEPQSCPRLAVNSKHWYAEKHMEKNAMGSNEKLG